jgi:histidinol-phosphate aminotransferase
MLPLAHSRIVNMKPYVPGLAMSATAKAFGLNHVVKLASNENPLGPSPKAVAAAKLAMLGANIYPIERRMAVKERICERHSSHNLRPEQVVLGNGSSELITLLVRSLISENEAVVFGWPSFLTYRLATQVQGCATRAVALNGDGSFNMEALIAACNAEAPASKLIFLTNPNNPTGQYIKATELDTFIAAIPPDVVVVLDEAYAEYAAVLAADIAEGIPWVQKRPRTVVLRTFSKVFGLAGLRIGYAVCDPDIAAVLHRVREPFNVNGIAQEAAMAALDDVEHEYRSRSLNAEQLRRLSAELKTLGFGVTPSVANFVLMHMPGARQDAEKLYVDLLKQGVIVRPVSNYDLPHALRVTVGTAEQNDRLLEALSLILRR